MSPYFLISHPEKRDCYYTHEKRKTQNELNGIKTCHNNNIKRIIRTCTFLGALEVLGSCLNLSLSCTDCGGPLGSEERAIG